MKQGGKVKGHTAAICLKDCRFLVGKKGQERVRREKKKNVHAGVSGYIQFDIPWWVGNTTCFVMYNPYKHDTFVERTGVCDDQHPIPEYRAGYVAMYKDNDRNAPTVMALEPEGELCETS